MKHTYRFPRVGDNPPPTPSKEPAYEVPPPRPAYVPPPDASHTLIDPAPAGPDRQGPARPTLLDAFGQARPKSDFGDGRVRLSRDAIVELIRLSIVGCVTTLIAQSLLMCVWMIAAGAVPGFAIFDGTPGTISAYTHCGWWQMIEFCILMVGAGSLWFSIYVNDGSYILKHRGRIDKSGASTLRWLDTYRWLCVMGAISHMLHLLFTWFEFADKQSTLYRNYIWCFLALVVLLVFEIILSMWQVTRIAVYQSNLYYSLTGGKDDGAFSMYMAASRPDEDAEEDNADVEHTQDVNVPSGPPPATQAAITPLLAQMRFSHGPRIKK